MLCIRGIAVDARGEKGRVEGEEFLPIFSLSKRKGVGAGHNLRK